jgi:hypothetical protein
MAADKDVIRVGNEVFNVVMTQNDMHDVRAREERQKQINRARKATLELRYYYRAVQQ